MRQTHHEHQSDTTSAGSPTDQDRTAEIRQDTRPVWYGPEPGSPDARDSAPYGSAPYGGTPAGAPSPYGAGRYGDPAGYGNTTAYGASTAYGAPQSPAG